jgi:hypothetical protein
MNDESTVIEITDPDNYHKTIALDLTDYDYEIDDLINCNDGPGVLFIKEITGLHSYYTEYNEHYEYGLIIERRHNPFIRVKFTDRDSRDDFYRKLFNLIML